MRADMAPPSGGDRSSKALAAPRLLDGLAAVGTAEACAAAGQLAVARAVALRRVAPSSADVRPINENAFLKREIRGLGGSWET